MEAADERIKGIFGCVLYESPLTALVLLQASTCRVRGT